MSASVRTFHLAFCSAFSQSQIPVVVIVNPVANPFHSLRRMIAEAMPPYELGASVLEA
jgi:hypothetical protein